jgi:hypothetical protein
MAAVLLCLLLGTLFADLAGGSGRRHQDESAARPPASKPCYGCWIGGRCYSAKSHNPKEYCQVCIPEWSKTRWSYIDQRWCDDGISGNGSDWCLGGHCVGHTYSDPCLNEGAFCNGYYTIDAKTDKCVWHDPPCADDGVFCNGEEYCVEHPTEPVPYECRRTPPPCKGRGNFCDGVTICKEETHECEEPRFPCPDDGLFCNGFEACDENKDACVHIGIPCGPTQICDEDTDACLVNDDNADKTADKSQGCGA